MPAGSGYAESVLTAFAVEMTATFLRRQCSPARAARSSARRRMAAEVRALGGCGIVFALIPAGSRYSEQILYRFEGPYDGWPLGSLIADKAGTLYGTTIGAPYADGTVFKLTPHGSLYVETILHTFLSPLRWGRATRGTHPRQVGGALRHNVDRARFAIRKRVHGDPVNMPRPRLLRRAICRVDELRDSARVRILS